MYKEIEKTKIEMAEIIKSNKRFSKIERVREKMTTKYGQVTAAGGSLTDCLYNKGFYDIDLFITIKELKDEFKIGLSQRQLNKKIVAVLEDSYEGEKVEIIVTSLPMRQYIGQFDITLKQIWLDNSGVHISNASAKSYKKGVLELNNITNLTELFRLHRAKDKYGLKINELDEWVVHNHLSNLKDFSENEVSEKYKVYAKEFKALPKRQRNYFIGYMTDMYLVNNCKKCKSNFVPFNRFRMIIRLLRYVTK